MRALIALVGAAMLAIGLVGPAIAGQGNGKANENSQATITVTWVGNAEDGCTDFSVDSTKDISFVSVNYTNFDYKKFEGINSPHYEYDESETPEGATIKSIVVKSGSTVRVFNCGESTSNDDTPECSDGADNDGDNKIDHPGGNPQEGFDTESPEECETPDDNDECPNGTDECPPVECESDADNDGICDEDEECPENVNDPNNESCPTDPCPGSQDTDGDGICDEDEECPENINDPDNESCPEPANECWAYILKIDHQGQIPMADQPFTLLAAGPNECELEDTGINGGDPTGNVPGNLRLLNAHTDESGASTRVIELSDGTNTLAAAGTDSPCDGGDSAFVIFASGAGQSVSIPMDPGQSTEVIPGVLYVSRIDGDTAQLIVLDGGEELGEIAVLESHCGPASS